MLSMIAPVVVAEGDRERNASAEEQPARMSRPRWSVPSRNRGSPRAAQLGGLSLYVRCCAVGSKGARLGEDRHEDHSQNNKEGDGDLQILRRNTKSHSPAPAITLSNEDPLLALTSALFRCVGRHRCRQDHGIDPRLEGDTAADAVEEELLPEIKPGRDRRAGSRPPCNKARAVRSRRSYSALSSINLKKSVSFWPRGQ